MKQSIQKSIKKSVAMVILMCALVLPTFAQDDLSTRTLMKRSIFYVKTDGTVHKADYWSIPMGKFDFTVKRDFPGEGELAVEGAANLLFISSGYIEGNGYGERGKLSVRAVFDVMDGDTLRPIALGEIDYIYMGGKKVKLKEAAQEENLYISVETPSNKFQPKKLSINIYWLDPEWGELQHKEDVSPILAISFTKAGAQKAYKAALKAAGM